MAEVMDAEKTEKLNKFAAQTGSDKYVAEECLKKEQWNLETALSAFKNLTLDKEQRREQKTDYVARPADNNRVGVLKRGLSMANSELVAHVRQHIKNCERATNVDKFDYFEETPSYTFMLPDISIQKDKDLVDFLKTDLIDKITYLSLTKAGINIINIFNIHSFSFYFFSSTWDRELLFV